MSYVKDLDGFSHVKYKGESFELIDGTKKTLHIAIPPVEINSDQAKVFVEIIEEADKKKIKVIIDMIE